MRLARTFSIAGFVHEASDLVAYHNNYYITDYKTHSVCVYTLDGISLLLHFTYFMYGMLFLTILNGILYVIILPS